MNRWDGAGFMHSHNVSPAFPLTVSHFFCPFFAPALFPQTHSCITEKIHLKIKSSPRLLLTIVQCLYIKMDDTVYKNEAKMSWIRALPSCVGDVIWSRPYVLQTQSFFFLDVNNNEGLHTALIHRRAIEIFWLHF